MSKQGFLNNTYLGINGELFTGCQLQPPLQTQDRRPFSDGSLFLDFNIYESPIQPDKYLPLYSKLDVDFHNETIRQQYEFEIQKARGRQETREFNERQFEVNENQMLETQISQRLLEIRNSMIPQGDKDQKVMEILRDLGRQNIGAKRGLSILQDAYFNLGMIPSPVIQTEINNLISHVQSQPDAEQEQSVGTDKHTADTDTGAGMAESKTDFTGNPMDRDRDISIGQPDTVVMKGISQGRIPQVSGQLNIDKFMRPGDKSQIQVPKNRLQPTLPQSQDIREKSRGRKPPGGSAASGGSPKKVKGRGRPKKLVIKD